MSNKKIVSERGGGGIEEKKEGGLGKKLIWAGVNTKISKKNV